MASDAVLVPDNQKDIAEVRERCRGMVRRRAAVSAGVAAVPIPGLDVVSDMKMFTALVKDINQAFGLNPDQIERLSPHSREVTTQAALGLGGSFVGKLITRELVLRVLKKVGVKLVTKSVARYVPFAGQIASAAIGFSVFRKLGYEHVEACTRVAQQVAQQVGQTTLPEPAL